MSFQQTLHRVKNMVSDRTATNLAAQYGLCIENVTWEDCARNKHSTWGPCISDMTLQVKNQPLPVVRLPNFSDLTWDQPLKSIPLNVGNQVAAPLHTTTLYEYLEHFSDYLQTPPSQPINLLAPERDQNAIMTAQACFLPIQQGKDTKFNVCLRNYQSGPGNPAVLVILASSSGTSAQVVTSSSVQTLYFNNDGQRASFVAKRLTDQRIELGQPTSGPMTQEEKADNMILVIQVPLVQRVVPPVVSLPYPQPYPYLPSPEPFQYQASPACFDECAVQKEQALFSLSSKKRKAAVPQRCDVDQAMISVGSDEGRFSELQNLNIARDHRYPIRVTLQYYKATSNGVVNAAVIEEIAVQMVTARSFTDHQKIGSLVTSHSTRTTEPQLQTPAWWSRFWHAYHLNFPHLSELEAKRRLFGAGNPYSSYSLEQAETELLMILSSGSQPAASTPSKPSWDPTVPYQMY